MILGNLGLSNLLNGIMVLFGHYYPSRTNTACAFQIGKRNSYRILRMQIRSFFIIFEGMIVSTSLVSVYSVLLVAIDRFLYILRGLQYQQYMYPNRVRILTAISWIISKFTL